MKKFVSILLIGIVVIFALSNVVLADKITEAVDKIVADEGSVFLNSLGGKLYGIILVVGSIVATVMLAIMAIKFMTAGPDGKAEVKKNLIGFSIGLLILLCTFSILGIVQNIAGAI